MCLGKARRGSHHSPSSLPSIRLPGAERGRVASAAALSPTEQSRADCPSNAERPVMPSGAWLRTVFPAECDLGLQAARHNRTRWRERRRLHHRRSAERRRPDRAAPSSGLVAVAALHHGRLRAAHNCRVSGAVAALDRATYLETGEVAPVNGGDYAEWTACRCRATQREPWCATPRLGITGRPA